MNVATDDEKPILTSKLLRQPMIVAIGLSLGIYLILILAYFLTGQPASPTSISHWLRSSLILIPALSLSILGHLRIRQKYAILPALTFLVLFYWLITILALMKAPFSFPSPISFQLMNLEDIATLNKFDYLITSTIHVIVFIPAVYIWSLTAEKIILAPMLNLKTSSITNSITGSTKRKKLGCLMVFIIGVFLYFALGLSVSGAALTVIPMVQILEIFLALTATSLYKIEERKFYILLVIWIFPTLILLMGLLVA